MTTRPQVWQVILAVIASALLSTAVVRGCSIAYSIWAMQSESADPFFRFVRNGKSGYIDASGKVVIPATLPAGDNSYGEFHEGLLRVREGKSFRYVDRSGATAFHTDAWFALDFSEGMAAVVDGSRDSWGFVDRTGNYAIAPRYSSVDSFSEGLARVSVEDRGRIGYIDERGDFVIAPKLWYGSSFREGLAAVIPGGPCQVANAGSCGRPLFREMANAPASDCKFAFVDKSGKSVSEIRLDDARDFSEGLAAVRLDSGWGYVDHSVHVVIQPQFDWAEPFSEGLAEVRIGEKFGFIDHFGNFVIQPQFLFASSFSNGRAVVMEFDRTGNSSSHYIDKTGTPAFPGEFPVATSFHHGLAHVALNDKGKFAFIDTSGKTVFAYDADGRRK